VTPPRFVVCFDRDEAVSTNPHPDPEKPAVPLGWVKYLAHGVESVDVWATGNQLLRGEAAIPGTARAVELWEALGGNPESRFAVPPPQLGRRNHLRIVQELYADHDPELVVVDDVDLSSMARYGWDHYFPWEFVDAVESDEAPVSIPRDHGFSDEPYRDDEVTRASHFDPTVDV